MKIKPVEAGVLGLWLLILAAPFYATSAGEAGVASWYARGEPGVGPLTASGEYFDDKLATCASWNFPFGTYLEITNLNNGKSVVCRVNDRGPREDLIRIVDLTKSSFAKIADPDLGLIAVSVRPLGTE